MTLLELQKKRHEQLHGLLDTLTEDKLYWVLKQIEELKEERIGIKVSFDTKEHTFYATDIEYITSMLAFKRGLRELKEAEDENQKRFDNITSSELQQTLDFLTVEEWGEVVELGNKPINLNVKDVPDIRKELERRKTKK